MKTILLLLIISFQTLASENKYIFENIYLGGGNWFENFKAVQTDAKGNTDDFEVAPFFSVAMDYKYRPKWYLAPEIGWVVSRKANSSRISKNLFFIRTDIAYNYTDKFKLKAGTSLMILNISGDGGEEKLPNGDGQDTYFLPSERRTALNQTLDFGLEYLFDKVALRGNAYIYAFIDSEERMVTYSLSLHYKLALDSL